MILTAEYNHGYPAVLKNALDSTFVEWRRKPVAYVGWGNTGGARAIEQLRAVAVEFEMAPLRHAVHVLPDVFMALRQAPDPADLAPFAPLEPGSTCWPTTWRGGCAPSRRRGPPAGRPLPWIIPSARCAPQSIDCTQLAGGLDDTQLVSQSYCDDWSIAQVLSHLGSGAVISRRGLQDVRAGTATPEDFNQSVWDEWNAKTPRAQADDALVADEAADAGARGGGRGRAGER